ncbi:MAG: hypothetical protein ORN54_07975, partial [Cyclobacteriaceae bacterium]|nr:hypothetical protein [Cyclobacteriaceae bacterium]
GNDNYNERFLVTGFKGTDGKFYVAEVNLRHRAISSASQSCSVSGSTISVTGSELHGYSSSARALGTTIMSRIEMCGKIIQAPDCPVGYTLNSSNQCEINASEVVDKTVPEKDLKFTESGQITAPYRGDCSFIYNPTSKIFSMKKGAVCPEGVITKDTGTYNPDTQSYEYKDITLDGDVSGDSVRTVAKSDGTIDVYAGEQTESGRSFNKFTGDGITGTISSIAINSGSGTGSSGSGNGSGTGTGNNGSGSGTGTGNTDGNGMGSCGGTGQVPCSVSIVGDQINAPSTTEDTSKLRDFYDRLTPSRGPASDLFNFPFQNTGCNIPVWNFTVMNHPIQIDISNAICSKVWLIHFVEALFAYFWVVIFTIKQIYKSWESSS